MIPKIIHYCWFGREPLPDYANKCIASWQNYMPDYELKLWNEDSFDIDSFLYTKEAYGCKKYAFVSDVARLFALKKDGGIYLDVDFIVYRSFDPLLVYKAFAGFEGSKHNPVMMGVVASEPDGKWIKEQLQLYEGRHFLVNGREDLTTNVKYISEQMEKGGFIPNGKEQDYEDLHIFPVDYFCPRLTTGEYCRTSNTYCEQLGGHSSWAKRNWKGRLIGFLPPSVRTRIILIKRRIIG